MTKLKYAEDIIKICHKKHLKVEDILSALQKEYADAGIATVYRTVKALLADDSLRKVTISNETYYEAALHDAPHAHIINDSAGTFKDCTLPKSILDQIEKHIGKEIKEIEVKIHV